MILGILLYLLFTLLAALGAGWIAEEALAIGLYCALVADDFEHGVRLAITHSGDSDSTGSITGQILGARYGAGVIPQRWLDRLELREVIDAKGGPPGMRAPHAEGDPS